MKRIQTRFFLQSFIPIMIVYALIVVMGLLYVNRYYERQALEQKSGEIENISRGINDWLVTRASEIITLSQVPLFEPGGRGPLRGYLADWRSRRSFIYERLYVIRPDGGYWCSDGRTGFLESRVFTAKFTEEIPKYFYIGPVMGEQAFADSVLAAVAVHRQGAILGVLAGEIPREVIGRMIGFFAFSEFDAYMLVDQFGTIITHSDRTLTGRSEREVYGREFTQLDRFQEEMVFVNVLRTTWKLVAFQSRSSLLRPMRRINNLVVISFFVVVAILVAVSYGTTSRIVRPILHLTSGVERIMAGDYRQHVQVETQDEMKVLADSFNRLSDRMIQMRMDDRFLFLGHVAARMAHEMRKPLHIIQLSALNMEARRTFSTKHTELILREVENADRFLKEILNFTKSDVLNLQRYTLSRLWEKILPKYTMVAEEQGVELVFRQGGPGPSFYLDIIRLEEAFSNLLDNAFQAARSAHDGTGGRPSVSIDQSYLPERGEVVRITDSGPGFDEKSLDRAFDPYYTTKEGGTGLGLSIAYRILSSHGARIELDNTAEGHGRVTILFPV